MFDANSQAAKPAHGAVEKARGRLFPLVGQDLAHGEPRIIIDGHMSELPTGALDRVGDGWH